MSIPSTLHTDRLSHHTPACRQQMERRYWDLRCSKKYTIQQLNMFSRNKIIKSAFYIMSYNIWNGM